MKNKITSLISLLALFTGLASPALSAITSADKQQMSYVNLLANGSGENGKQGWTASGGTFSTSTTSADLIPPGTTALTWASSGSAQTLTGSAVTVNGLAGLNGEMTCMVRVPSGTATHTFGIWNGSTLSQTQTVSSTSTYKQQTINFIFPSSGTVAPRFTSVSGSEPSISITDCYTGVARNIGSAAQSVLVGGVVVTGCASEWTTASSTFASGPAQTGCVYTPFGSAQAPSTNIAAFKFASLPPGDYAVEYEGRLGQSGSGQSVAQFTDGTNVAREFSVVDVSASASVPGFRQTISYTTPQSNITLEAKMKTTASAIFISGKSTYPGVFRLWYYPSSSSQVFNLSTYSGLASGTASFSGTTTATSFADLGSVTGSYTPTTNTVTNISCVTNASSKAGIDCNLPRTGKYLVCYTGYGFTSSTGTNYYSRLVDGSGNVIVPTQGGRSYTTTGFGALGSCGLYAATSTSVTFKAQGQTDAGGATATLNITGFSVASLDQAFPAPVLTGSITSNSAGAERLERFKFFTTAYGTVCSASTCGITSSLSGATVTRSSTGIYSLNFPSGTFSSPPTCTFAVNDATLNAALAYPAGTLPSTTAYPFQSSRVTNTNFDVFGDVICMGPR